MLLSGYYIFPNNIRRNIGVGTVMGMFNFKTHYRYQLTKNFVNTQFALFFIQSHDDVVFATNSYWFDYCYCPCHLLNRLFIHWCPALLPRRLYYFLVLCGGFDKNKKVDVIGICKAAGEAEDVTSRDGKKYRKRDFDLCDSKTEVKLTLWESTAILHWLTGPSVVKHLKKNDYSLQPSDRVYCRFSFQI